MKSALNGPVDPQHFYDQRSEITHRIKACIRSLIRKNRTPQEIKDYLRKCYGKNAIIEEWEKQRT